VTNLIVYDVITSKLYTNYSFIRLPMTFGHSLSFCGKLKPNSITLSWSQTGSEVGRRPAASWNLAYHLVS